MPKRTDIHKILVIGSGPIVIGQAAEFDYAGTQACLALKEEGYEVVLCNSNPATIMTDTSIADKVYMEPLTLEYIAKIVRKERPDAILPGIGGQTGLNLAMQLEKKGVLAECHTELLGTKSYSIEQAEDRELFSRRRTANCSKNCACVWANPFSPQRSRALCQKAFRRRAASGILSYCVPPSRWAVPEEASRTARRSSFPS